MHFFIITKISAGYDLILANSYTVNRYFQFEMKTIPVALVGDICKMKMYYTYGLITLLYEK